jgi:putative redox protein
MENLLENDITGHIGTQKYLCTLFWRNGKIITDEPEIIGGRDLGPDPYSMLLASLASCTLSTLRMYIDHKGWTVSEINIALNMTRETEGEMVTTISKTLTFPPNVTEEQRIRLLQIAEKCPISKILKGTITINTL